MRQLVTKAGLTTWIETGIQADGTLSSCNSATANYSVLQQLRGKTILVDAGCGAEMNEDWSNDQ